MISFSLISPDNFFSAFGVNGDAAFRFSWSMRYLALAALMLLSLGLAFYTRAVTPLSFTIFARLMIDVTDAVGVFLFDTPMFSWGWISFHILALLGPEVISLILLWRVYLRNKQPI
jgi:hypothetical protein